MDNLPDYLVQIIFGWPAILLSLAVSITGILKKWVWMLVLGGVLCAPFAFYLSGWPGIRYLAFLLPFFQFGAAWSVHKDMKTLAWVLLFPLAGISIFLAIVVLNQKIG
jgi:hypothetical protein